MNTPLLPGTVAPDPEPARPHRLWGMLRRNLRIIILGGAVGALLGVAAASEIQPRYAVRVVCARHDASALVEKLLNGIVSS